MLSFSIFSEYPELKYGFSSSSDGSMERHLEKGNREEYFAKLGILYTAVVTPDLTHGTNVLEVGSEEGGLMIADADGLITKEKDLFLTATSADCFLVYLYDPKSASVGIFHAGWRGVLGGIAIKTIEKMVSDLGSSLDHIKIGIGPGIQKCHFEISTKDLNLYHEYAEFISQENEKYYADLPGILKLQFARSGVPLQNIEDGGQCTYCKENEYFSFRRDKPPHVQPMVGYIGRIK